MKDKITFKRDEKTGEIIAYKNGEMVSKVNSKGEELKEKNKAIENSK